MTELVNDLIKKDEVSEENEDEIAGYIQDPADVQVFRELMAKARQSEPHIGKAREKERIRALEEERRKEHISNEVPVTLTHANARNKYSIEVRIPKVVTDVMGVSAGEALFYTLEEGNRIVFERLPRDRSPSTLNNFSRLTERGKGSSLGIIVPVDARSKFGIDEKTPLSVRLSNSGYFVLEKVKVEDKILASLLRPVHSSQSE